ncbi:Agmatine coumaroyltransferase-2 [Nymphaea thermarum]|nr:Agmatine coumaroyltransferase-2 [Nymphaea thermarum]
MQGLEERIPLSIFDQAASNLVINVLLAFSPPTPNNDSMKSALAKALANFPFLTGRLSKADHEDKHPCVILAADACVPVFEANVVGCSELADLHLHEPTAELSKLQPPMEATNQQVMAIQLNRLDCGGLVVALSTNHKVADGQSMSSFLVAWGKVLRGKEIEPLPLHDRSLFAPRDPPVCEFPHERVEFTMERNHVPPVLPKDQPVVNIVVHYSDVFLKKMRETASQASGGDRLTRFQCLAAHVWRKLTVARRLEDTDQKVNIRIAVNGRPRLMFPEEFFGNLVLCTYPSATVKELLQKDGLGHALKAIKDAVGQMDRRYFQSFIDFGELRKGEKLIPAPEVEGELLSPNMEVDSWLTFQFHQIDIGGGSAIYAFSPSWIPVEGVAIFVPASSSKHMGGVDVHLSLLAHQAETFRNIAHSLE